ncbi:hypothetical protein BDF21DRAFT_396625 [Thamnidium elegans]|nr:hypothetical protein BDF21DRAFT_396625 [Thamnidium elegans]
MALSQLAPAIYQAILAQFLIYFLFFQSSIHLSPKYRRPSLARKNLKVQLILPKFSEEFKSLYAAKSRRIQYCSLKENSHMLSLKAKDNAAAITDKTLDLIKESTLREMDNEIDVDQNELIEKEAANIDTEEFMGTSKEAQF